MWFHLEILKFISSYHLEIVEIHNLMENGMTPNSVLYISIRIMHIEYNFMLIDKTIQGNNGYTVICFGLTLKIFIK